uniref:Uncharacterized protein n=1 Tax=Pundamilia nyererei TaxID=303518 RepID=A0A3B4EZD3_9CICH
MSKTYIRIVISPDLAGLPPSRAVSANEWVPAASLSKDFCTINIGIFPSSPLSFTSNRKWSFELSLYC